MGKKDPQAESPHTENPNADPAQAEPVQSEPAQTEQPKPPSHKRLRGRWITLIVVASVLVVFVVAAFVTAHYTSRSSFCDACHEMEPYYASWQASSHASAECVDCHIPPGFVPYVETKLYSFREVWVHLTGGADAPLTVTREIPRSSCRRCHELPDLVNFGTSSFSHAAHPDQPCVKCHVRIVHKSVNPPSYSSPGTMQACLVCHDGTTAPSDCAYCHTPGHEPRGDCAVCHDIQDWGSNFVHPLALTGGHAGVACATCHKATAGGALIPGTSFPAAPSGCISCHGDHHGGLTDCSRCHSVAGWKPAHFSHPRVGPHISGEHPLTCSRCHTSGFGGAVSCTACHDSASGGGDD